MTKATTNPRIPRDRSYPESPDVPLRVYVGAAESDMIAARVLEHSIKKHASRKVDFVPMLMPMPLPKDKHNRPVTRFSFKRFLIPQLAGYRGRALYMDSDMQVFADLAELWKIPFGDHRLLCSVQAETPERWRNDKSNFHPGRHFAVMLLDCSRLDWDAADIVRGLDEQRYTYKQLMSDMCVVPKDMIGETLPPEWNSLEKYERGVSKNVHYTVIRTQPWRYAGNPLEEVWWQGYREAIAAGSIDFEMVANAVRRRWCRPELLDEFEGGRQARARFGFKLSVAATRSASAVRRAFLGREY